jgi:hypothetical protein
MIPGFIKRLVFKNCINGETKIFKGIPAGLGGAKSDFFIDDSEHDICTFEKNDTGLVFRNHSNLDCLIDGSHATKEHIPPEQDHSMVIRDQLFLFKYTRVLSSLDQKRQEHFLLQKPFIK